MPTLKQVLKVIVSAPIMAGAGMLAMATGIVDVDPTLGAIASVYSEPLNLPLKPLLALVGATKLLSILKLWGYGPVPSLKLAVLGLACPASAAVYGHYKVEGPAGAVAPTIYLGILGFWYHLEATVNRNEDSKKKL
jgi:hypothetical protein